VSDSLESDRFRAGGFCEIDHEFGSDPGTRIVRRPPWLGPQSYSAVWIGPAH
jgi:hypothetical protein